VLGGELGELALDALVALRALARKEHVVAAPGEARGEDHGGGPLQARARASQDRVTAQLGQGEVILGGPEKEAVDHHFLGRGVERRRLQAQPHRRLLHVEDAVLHLREVAQLGLDHAAVGGVHQDADLEAVVGPKWRRLSRYCQVRIVSSETNVPSVWPPRGRRESGG
jgi:hypothetical protein